MRLAESAPWWRRTFDTSLVAEGRQIINQKQDAARAAVDEICRRYELPDGVIPFLTHDEGQDVIDQWRLGPMDDASFFLIVNRINALDELEERFGSAGAKDLIRSYRQEPTDYECELAAKRLRRLEKPGAQDIKPQTSLPDDYSDGDTLEGEEREGPPKGDLYPPPSPTLRAHPTESSETLKEKVWRVMVEGAETGTEIHKKSGAAKTYMNSLLSQWLKEGKIERQRGPGAYLGTHCWHYRIAGSYPD